MKCQRALPIVTIVLLSISAWAGTETVLHDFSGGNDGTIPADVGRLARDKAGNLYGTAQGGGACSQGIVFELSESGGSWTENVLYSFCFSDGNNPVGGVTLDSSGNIYGTTKFGSSGGCGTVFRLSGSTLTTLYSFTCGSDGGKPDAGVVIDAAGNLYGTTQQYGPSGIGHGVAYEISNSGTFNVIYAFCSVSGCADGSYPDGGLVLDRDGALYGTTTSGGDQPCSCGTVFRLSKSGGNWIETVLHSFAGGVSDGAIPTYASLTLITQTIGNSRRRGIVGVTMAGGAANLGTVFGMLRWKGGFKFGLLHSFAGPDGESPFGTLAVVKGKLVGTTYGLVGSSNGNVFRLTRDSGAWTESVAYDFSGGSDGGNPVSGVVGDSAGNLYGVTGSGGFGLGVVYEVTP